MGDYKKLLFTAIDQIWRRRRVALLFAWMVCGIGWVIVAMLPDRYTSEARIYVDTQSLLNPLLKGISVRADDTRSAQDVAVLQRTVTRRPNLLKVAQMTDLDKSATTQAEAQALIDSLESRVEVTNQGNNLFRVAFTDNSSAMAMRVVQALITVFQEDNIGDRRADMQTARSFIQNQLQEYEDKLSEAEHKLAEFKVANVDYISNTNENFSTRLQQARVAVKDREREYDDAVAQREQLRSQLKITPQFVSFDAAPAGNNAGPTIPQRIRMLEARIADLRLTFTDKHPEIARSLDALNALKAQLENSEKKEEGARSSQDRAQLPNEVYNQLTLRLADVDAKITTAKRRVDDGKNELDDLQKRSAEGPRIEAEYVALTRDYQVMKSSYDNLLARRESARIAEAADSSADSVQFRMIAPPEEPAAPTGPKRHLFNIALLVVGIVAGCGFAILLARLEDCVTMADDLSTFRDHLVLGCISVSELLTIPEPFIKRHRRFALGVASLILVGVLTASFAPNLSTVPSAIATRLALL